MRTDERQSAFSFYCQLAYANRPGRVHKLFTIECEKSIDKWICLWYNSDVRKRKEVINMYNVEASNGGGKVTVEVCYRDLGKNGAKFVAGILSKAFRDVRIINADTGEVMYNIYYYEGFAKPTVSLGNAIEEVDGYLNE